MCVMKNEISYPYPIQNLNLQFKIQTLKLRYFNGSDKLTNEIDIGS